MDIINIIHDNMTFVAVLAYYTRALKSPESGGVTCYKLSNYAVGRLAFYAA